MNECAKKMSKRSSESIQRRQGIKIKNHSPGDRAGNADGERNGSACEPCEYDKIEYVTAIIGKNMMAVFYVDIREQPADILQG